jgi:hypothetical protein
MSDFDPYQFGRLTAQVQSLENDVADLRQDVKALLALAERHKGGLWAGMSVASLVGGAIAYVTEHFFRRG